MRPIHVVAIMLAIAFGVTLFVSPGHARGASAEQINRDVKIALDKLYAKSETAKALGEKAKGVLVFPGITKGGFIVGGQYGEGALLKGGKIAGYYNTVAASYGLQVGLQKYGYALFLMTDAALGYLDKSDGWELGTAPNIVIVDKGASGSISSTSLQSDMYVFFFDQKGLMAGLGLQGTKITKIQK